MTIYSNKTLMSSSTNSHYYPHNNHHRTSSRDTSYSHHHHQSLLESVSSESSSPESSTLNTEKHHRSSSIKKKPKHHRQRSSDRKSRTHRSPSSDIDNESNQHSRNSQRSRHDTTSRTSRTSQQPYYHTHSRDTTNETSLNETNFDIKNKKRKIHYIDNSNYSPKRHRRSSPLSSYPMSIHPSQHYHHHRTSKYHRRSSSSSTHSSDHSPFNENNNNNQYQRSTKGTLASELDKLRPKINKTKTITTNIRSQNEQQSKNDINVSILQKIPSLPIDQSYLHSPFSAVSHIPKFGDATTSLAGDAASPSVYVTPLPIFLGV
jgi:hypothetical protein